MKVLLLALMATYVLSAIDTKVTNCMTGETAITWTAATFSVVPSKGVNETISLYGNATAHAELANVFMVAYWNGLEAFTDNYPDDEAWDKGDPVSYQLTQLFPTYTPSGKMRVQFWFQSASGKNFTCAEIGFTI